MLHIADLKEEKQKLIDVEYEAGDDWFYSLPVFGYGQARSAVNAGVATTSGEAGKLIDNEITRLEAALLVLNSELGELSTGRMGVSAAINSNTALMYGDALKEQIEAKAALKKLRALTTEEWDDLPDLFKTDTGESIFK